MSSLIDVHNWLRCVLPENLQTLADRVIRPILSIENLSLTHLIFQMYSAAQQVRRAQMKTRRWRRLRIARKRSMKRRSVRLFGPNRPWRVNSTLDIDRTKAVLNEPDESKLEFQVLRPSGHVWKYRYPQPIDWTKSVTALNAWRKQTFSRLLGPSLDKAPINAPYHARETAWLIDLHGEYKMQIETMGSSFDRNALYWIAISKKFNQEFQGRVLPGCSYARPVRSAESIRKICLSIKEITDITGRHSWRRIGKEHIKFDRPLDERRFHQLEAHFLIDVHKNHKETTPTINGNLNWRKMDWTQIVFDFNAKFEGQVLPGYVHPRPARTRKQLMEGCKHIDEVCELIGKPSGRKKGFTRAGGIRQQRKTRKQVFE